MESFYGGKTGAAFVIVKRFDGIDIPQPNDGVSGNVVTYTYTKNLYAIDSITNAYIVTTEAEGGNVAVGVYDSTTKKYIPSTTQFLVARTKDNYDHDGWGWRVHENNGDPINDSTAYVFLEELAQGMVQFFAQGAASANEVNYGEYVIIDTICNMHEKNNPDNGKVYRRGMDITSTLAGAEYIGQIVGPEGEIAEIDLDTYSAVLEQSDVKTGKYTPTELVPGYDYDGNYNDNIEFAWANVKNELGEIDEYLIGFTFPYLTFEFETSHVDPYDENGKYADMTSISRIDDKSHPFYEKWHIDIPKGIKGDLIENLRAVYYDVPAGTKYKYSQNEGLLPVKARIVYKFYDYYDTTLDTTKWVDVYLWDETSQSYKSTGKGYEYQVQIKNAVAGLAYTEKNFENLQDGESEYLYLGPYNIIEDVLLDDDGTVTVQYSHDNDKVFDQAIQWIDNVKLGSDGDFLITYNTYKYDEEGKKTLTHNTYETSLKWVNGVSLNDNGILTFTYSNDPDNPYVFKSIKWIDAVDQAEDGTITITYNTLSDPDDPTSAHDTKVFDYCMKYIQSVSLDANGDFKVIFNTKHEDPDNPGTYVNDEYNTKIYWVRTMDLTQEGILTTTMNDGTVSTKTLNWIDLMEVEDDGTVKYYYNSDHTNPTITQEKLVKWIEDVRLDANNGIGSQQISVKYNTDKSSYTTIGDPLNYILETVISENRNDTPVKPYHLLVLYSDPDRRAGIASAEKAQYPSKYPQYEGQSPSPDGTYMRTDWHDLGNIRGAKGGFNTICETANGLEDLHDDSETPVQIPPEYVYYAMKVRATGESYIYDETVGRDEYYAGWGTVKTTTNESGEIESEFFFYDYDLATWFSIGGITVTQIQPEEIVVIEESTGTPNTLDENGIWFVTYDRKMAN